MQSTRWSLRYRPHRFSQILGQNHIISFFGTVLGHWFEKSIPLPVGVLFSGHSGVGKTTLARVVGCSLNCEHREGVEPCGECSSCTGIIQGRGTILEIDASFSGSADSVRELKNCLESYSFMGYQVVILDECHMLSDTAFNVLLKLFEEPPEKVFFILVTTRSNKVLETVRSRLLEFRFRGLRWQEISKFLLYLFEKEKVKCDKRFYPELYQASGNNLRELLVLAEQLSILGNGEITAELIEKICGDVLIYEKIVNAIKRQAYDETLSLYEGFFLVHSDFVTFINGFLNHLGNSFKQVLVQGGDTVFYITILRCIYRFLSYRMQMEGIAAAKLLFFDIFDSLHLFKSTTKEQLLRDEELFTVLTKLDS